jgi:hypothetical protein
LILRLRQVAKHENGASRSLTDVVERVEREPDFSCIFADRSAHERRERVDDQKIFERYADGDGHKRIVKELNRRGIPSPRSGKRGTGSWAPNAVREMLRRTRYIGVIEYGRQKKGYKSGTKVRTQRPEAEIARIDAPHLRIVDDVLWRRVEARFAKVARGEVKRGPPTRHLLSGIARCAECGGPLTVTNHRLGSHHVKVYLCAYHRSRGESVCSNTARRPVSNIDGALLDWIRSNILTEELTADLIRGVRRRLDDRAKADTSRSPALEKEARGLRAEIDRFVEAVASGGSLRAQAAAPDAIRFELKRLEAEAGRRLNGPPRPPGPQSKGGTRTRREALRGREIDGDAHRDGWTSSLSLAKVPRRLVACWRPTVAVLKVRPQREPVR